VKRCIELSTTEVGQLILGSPRIREQLEGCHLDTAMASVAGDDGTNRVHTIVSALVVRQRLAEPKAQRRR
jgi:hypothetical protein